jgi:hypothetical protein
VGELADNLPQQIVLVAVELLAQPGQRVHVVVDHRVLPLVALRRNFKRLTRWSSRPGDLRPLHHYLGLNFLVASDRPHQADRDVTTSR